MDASHYIILAAGAGSRLGEYTKLWPKCLMPVHGVPLLSYWIDQISTSKERSSVYINISVHSEIVRDFINKLQNQFELDLKVVYESKLLGTGGSLREIIRQFNLTECTVIHADNYSDIDLNKFLSFARNSECSATLATFLSDYPETCGIVEQNRHGHLSRMFEKVANPPSNKANAAVYFFKGESIEYIRKDFDFTDIATDFMAKNPLPIDIYHHGGMHIDIGDVARLLDLKNKKIIQLKNELFFKELADDFYRDAPINIKKICNYES